MNNLKITIISKCPHLFTFRPKTELYSVLNIGQKRFGQLLRNEKQPTLDELQRIADYFNVMVNDLIVTKQSEA